MGGIHYLVSQVLDLDDSIVGHLSYLDILKSEAAKTDMLSDSERSILMMAISHKVSEIEYKRAKNRLERKQHVHSRRD